MTDATKAAAMTLGLVLLAQGTGAQDSSPNPNRRVLLENERVRVVEVILKPGEMETMHPASDRVIYPLTSFKVKHVTADGKTSVDERKAGQPAWGRAVSQATQNVGTTDVHAIIVEIKDSQKR